MLKYSKAKVRMTGIVIILAKLAIAVKVTESAMFPLQSWVIKLLVGPPGQAAMMIKPSAMASLSPKRMAREKPIRGRKIS